jgi:hypothetical protein
MSENPCDNPGDKTRPPRRRFTLKMLLAIIGTFLVISGLGLANSTEVRLDTGDQRDCFWGIPIVYRPMEPKSRVALLSLDDSRIPKEWVWCATQVGSNNAHWMVYHFYRDAAAWVRVDTEIARAVVRDIASYVQTSHATHGLPDSWGMISFVLESRGDSTWVVEGWEKNPRVRAYLAQKGLALNATHARSSATHSIQPAR